MQDVLGGDPFRVLSEFQTLITAIDSHLISDLGLKLGA